MKILEFRKLIREEVRKIIKEVKQKRSKFTPEEALAMLLKKPDAKQYGISTIKPVIDYKGMGTIEKIEQYQIKGKRLLLAHNGDEDWWILNDEGDEVYGYNLVTGKDLMQ